ncbi:kctd6 [Symbiodinium microadriaticum]|nr:kctd6 [Symbiodinium microadriaticum]
MQLDEESKRLQEIWIRIATLKRSNEDDVDKVLSCEELTFVKPDNVIALNIGGQLFEAPVAVLIRDPFSVLASLCRVKPPIPSGKDGVFYFDRDWWIFRHILSYLRSSVLPTDLETLKELHAEATYYRIELLQKAIEDIPLDQIQNYNASAVTMS